MKRLGLWLMTLTLGGWASWAFLMALTACPKPTPGTVEPGHPGIVQCGASAVEKCAPGAVPAVNECLAGTSEIVGCLLGLIQPAGCITYEVIACLTRHEGAAAERAYAANPDDVRDKRRAARAKEFLDKTGAKFAD
jgi:hypothetical protein